MQPDMNMLSATVGTTTEGSTGVGRGENIAAAPAEGVVLLWTVVTDEKAGDNNTTA